MQKYCPYFIVHVCLQKRNDVLTISQRRQYSLSLPLILFDIPTKVHITNVLHYHTYQTNGDVFI